MKRGVVVATDQHLEWLLPWWWERYSSCNELPVTFVDFGMTKSAQIWCSQRGHLLATTLQVDAIQKCNKAVLASWQEIYGSSYRTARNAWFKKPLACLMSPFDESVWLDLDCEVLSSIVPIFDFLSDGAQLAIALDRVAPIPEGFAPHICADSVRIMNGGVIVFPRGSALIQQWAELAQQEAHLYWGDDYILSTVIQNSSEFVRVLPPIYNWRLADGVPFYAKIIHWCGEWGKACIAKRGGMKGMLANVPDLQKIFFS